MADLPSKDLLALQGVVRNMDMGHFGGVPVRIQSQTSPEATERIRDACCRQQ